MSHLSRRKGFNETNIFDVEKITNQCGCETSPQFDVLVCGFFFLHKLSFDVDFYRHQCWSVNTAV